MWNVPNTEFVNIWFPVPGPVDYTEQILSSCVQVFMFRASVQIPGIGSCDTDTHLSDNSSLSVLIYKFINAL